MTSSSQSPHLSVVISTLGNYDVLRRVLDGYDNQDARRESFEVLVVSDAVEAHPELVERAIATRGYAVRQLTGRVPGLSANRNAGWRAARAPIVLFTDNDTIPAPGLVAEHLSWHGRFGAENVAVTGLVRWARGLKVTPFMKWLDRGVQFDFQSIEGEEATWAHLYGANSSIKRALLERVGGYDEERLPYLYEDLDWGYRARDHGLRVMLNRRAVVEHWRPTTIESWQARAPRLALSEWHFCQLHPDVAPWFQRMFADAAAHPPGGSRSARLARFVPRATPWLGPVIWDRAALHWRQQLAPHFLEVWDALVAGESPEVAPAAAALAGRS